MMKKKVLIFLLAFTVVVLVIGFIFRDFLLASKADTSAPVQKASVNITIDANPPDLIVASPTNTDYSTNQIDIKYFVSDSSSGVDIVWYNLDGGQNITLTGNKAITVTKGQHTLFIYASDKVGLVNDSEFVTFSVK